jgi:hypothetical protein
MRNWPSVTVRIVVRYPADLSKEVLVAALYLLLVTGSSPGAIGGQ